MSLPQLPADPSSRAARFRYHASVQWFRFATALLAWALIAAAFYYRPDLIKYALRSGTRAIEAIGDSIPYPWGDRIEIMLREIGGFVWIQITALIIIIRASLSLLSVGLRKLRKS